MKTQAQADQEMKRIVDEMSAKKIASFSKELDEQIQQIGPLEGKSISATTIDNWLRRAASQAKLELASPNRVAFHLWTMLIAKGATITQQENCMITPFSDFEEKLARTIQHRFSSTQ